MWARRIQCNIYVSTARPIIVGHIPSDAPAADGSHSYIIIYFVRLLPKDCRPQRHRGRVDDFPGVY